MNTETNIATSARKPRAARKPADRLMPKTAKRRTKPDVKPEAAPAPVPGRLFFTIRLPAKFWDAHTERHSTGFVHKVVKAGKAVTVTIGRTAFENLLSDAEYPGGWVSVKLANGDDNGK